MCQRGQYGDAGIHAGHQVADRDAGLLRAATGQVITLTGNRHETADALHDEIVAGALGIRAVLAKAGDRAIHQIGFDLLQRFIIQAVFF